MSINAILDANIRCGQALAIAVSYVESERWESLGGTSCGPPAAGGGVRAGSTPAAA